MEKEFTHIITEHEKIIFKICKIYGTTVEEQEDLFQDIVLQLWKSFPAFRGEAKVQTWMYRVALNTAITSLRKHKTKKHVSVGIDTLKIPIIQGESAQAEEKQELLYAAIGKLSDIEKALITLYLEGYNYKEMAEIMGISESHVGLKLHKIKHKLKDIILA